MGHPEQEGVGRERVFRTNPGGEQGPGTTGAEHVGSQGRGGWETSDTHVLAVLVKVK